MVCLVQPINLHKFVLYKERISQTTKKMRRKAMNKKNFDKYLPFFKSIIDQDRCAVVICNLEHEIIYMNPAAISNYSKRGGDKLIGRSIMDCHNAESQEKMKKVIEWFDASPEHNIVYTFYNEKQNKDVYMVALRDGEKLIGYYEKHEFRNREKDMKMYDLT